jgi:DNA (cytosine-5)-methyltransferase 1
VAGNEFRYGSLFSGIGGIDLGLDLAGFECAWQVELDEHCRRILEEHWPRVPKYKDIYEVKGSEVEPVDILCGGFPCQPVSVAGKRGGVDDERWLWDEFYRLICEIRPRWVVAENVTGLLSANSGRAFAGVLRDLAEGRYDAVWDVFPAGGPGGVGAPHKRERVFLVAHATSSKPIKKSRNVGEVFGVSEEVGKDIGAVVSGGGSKHVADSKSKRYGRRTGKKRRITKRELQQEKQGRSKMGSKTEGRSRTHGDVANTNKKRLQRSKETRNIESEGQDGEEYIARCNKGAEQWFVEPNVGRVADGISNRVDRLKALGNAVVPQVAYKVARMIYEYTEKEKRS